MKALMGNLAKTIKNDHIGNKELRAFISSNKGSKTITLSNGKKFKITTNKETVAA